MCELVYFCWLWFTFLVSLVIRLDFDERLRCFKVSTQDVQTKKTPFCPDHYSFIKLEGVSTFIGDLKMKQRVVK